MDQIEKTSPPLFNVKSTIDPSKWNAVASEIPEVKKAREVALDAEEKLAQALQERYAQPNYFKIAAGFAKPQLGGFLASLGSASEAMGENVEAQRAMEPTIQRMRAEIAQGRAGMAVNTAQAQGWEKYKKDGVSNPNELSRLLALGPSSDVGQAIKDQLALEQGERTKVTFGLDVQQKLLDNPALSLPNLRNIGYDFSRTPEESAKYVQDLNSSVPQGFDPKAWQNLGVSAKLEAIASTQQKRADTVMEEGQKSATQANEANKMLDLLATTRKLAVDPELAELFSLGRNGDLFSQARAFLDKNQGNASNAAEGMANAAFDKLKNKNEATRAKVDKLVKDIYAIDALRRGSMQNPTDAATFLFSQSSPSLQNSQQGFVGILDQLGLNSYRDIEMHSLRRKMKIPNDELLDTATMRKFRNETRKLAEELASNVTLDSTPSFYYSDIPKSAPAAPPPAKPSASSSPPTSSSIDKAQSFSLEAIRAERERRKAAKNQNP